MSQLDNSANLRPKLERAEQEIRLRTKKMTGTRGFISRNERERRELRRSLGEVNTLWGLGGIVQLWMFLTPVIYPTHLVPAQYRSLYMLNPMAPLVTSYRNVILEGIAPDWGYLGYTLAISVVLLAGSYLLFKKNEPLFAERV